MRSILKNNWQYLAVYCCLVCIAVYYILNFDKIQLHSKMNTVVGNPTIDTLFTYVTHIGDGLVAGIIACIVLLLNAKKGVFILVTYVVSGLTTNVLKTYVFDVNRPHFVFGYYGHYFPQYKINYVEGVKMLGLNSFPSGHATTSFAVFIALSLITENKFLKFIFFVFAFLGAYSRTYLSQHWLVDITVGSLIGTGAALIFYVLFFSSNSMQKYNKPLLKIFNN